MSRQEDCGYCICQSDTYIIRERIKDGKVELFVHKRDKDGTESLPRGYLQGTNYLVFDLP
jgi:hypothetical protein